MFSGLSKAPLAWERCIYKAFLSAAADGGMFACCMFSTFAKQHSEFIFLKVEVFLGFCRSAGCDVALTSVKTWDWKSFQVGTKLKGPYKTPLGPPSPPKALMRCWSLLPDLFSLQTGGPVGSGSPKTETCHSGPVHYDIRQPRTKWWGCWQKERGKIEKQKEPEKNKKDLKA